MLIDPRDKPDLNHDDILSLNFIKDAGTFLFRRHYRSGLRSHIMEMVRRSDVEAERKGIPADGIRIFPKARPRKMLRIFKTRFRDLRAAQEEIRRVKIVERFLAPEYMALSSEFLVELRDGDKKELLLCGVQEYVAGEVLDPWGAMGRDHILSLYGRMCGDSASGFRVERGRLWLEDMMDKAQEFVSRMKTMIIDSGHVPDLAGVGNLILAPSGHIRLVDINNISTVRFGSSIPLDDRGYPVCDKSIEALFLIEQGLLGQSLDTSDPIYMHFLGSERRRKVSAQEYKFHCTMGNMPGAQGDEESSSSISD
jgi:hypothetical protein